MSYTRQVGGTLRIITAGGAPAQKKDPTALAVPPSGTLDAVSRSSGGELGPRYRIEYTITAVDETNGAEILVMVASRDVLRNNISNRRHIHTERISNETGSYVLETPQLLLQQGERVRLSAATIGTDGKLSVPVLLGAMVVEPPEEIVVGTNLPSLVPQGVSVVTETFDVTVDDGDIDGDVPQERVRRVAIYEDAADTGAEEHPQPFTIPDGTGGYGEASAVVYAQDSAGTTLRIEGERVGIANFVAPVEGDTGDTGLETGLDTGGDTGAAPTGPLGADDWSITIGDDPVQNDGSITMWFRVPDRADIERLVWIANGNGNNAIQPGQSGGGGECIKHPAWGTPGDPNEFTWLQRASLNAGGGWAGWLDRTGTADGTEDQMQLRWSSDDAETVALEDAVFADWSPVKTYVFGSEEGDTGLDTGSGTGGDTGLDTGGDTGIDPGGDTGEEPVTAEVAYLQTNSRGEYEQNWPGGQGHQQTPASAQCRDYPNVIAIGIDMGSIAVSTDKGRTWGFPRRTGMYSACCQGLAIDPVNPLYWLQQAVADPVTDSASAQWGGLYWSGDGLDSGKRVYSFNNTISDGNHLQAEALCFHPNSSNGTRCMKAAAYLVGSSGHHFVTSEDGGENWTLRYSGTGHGTPRTMVPDPSNDNAYIIGTSSGLWRVTNAHGSESFTRLRAGNVYSKAYVSANGQTIICGFRNSGVYKSTGGGGSWTQVEADSQLHKCFVNPFNPDRMLITYHSTSSDWTIKPRFCTNGSSFTTANNLEKRPDFNGGLNSQFEHVHAFYFGTGGEVFMCGRHTFRHSSDSNFRSTDSGNNWSLSMRGFSLEAMNTWMSPQMFHPTNPAIFCAPYTDLGVSYTNNGGKWFTLRRAHQELSNMDHGTANVAIMHPNGSRVLASVGRSNRGILVRLEMPNGSAFAPIDKTTRKYHGLCYDADNPDYWFAEQYRSTSGGVSWSPLGSLGSDDLIWGCTTLDSGLGGGQAIFTLNEGGDHRTVKRSTNRGTSFSTVLTASYHLVNGIGTKQSPFRPHPQDHTILFTQTPNGRGIRRWNLASGSSSNRPSDDFFPPVPGGVPFRILGLAIDPRHPDTWVIMNQYVNSGYAVMRTTDAGDNWENLTHLVPQAKPNLLEISGANGDIVFGCSNGARLIKAHYDDPNSNVSNVLWPNNIFDLNYMDEVMA